MVTRFRGAVLLVRDLEAATQFFTGGLGLAVIHRAGSTVELDGGGGETTLSIQAVDAG
jgi:catechol 2,3-dioxygenase-like lactoylglutathione lyase family enzyme